MVNPKRLVNKNGVVTYRQEWWRRARRLWWRYWPSRGKWKLLRKCFLLPTIFFGLSVWIAVVFWSWWQLWTFAVWGGIWWLTIRNYRRLMKNPMMYLWMLEQEFSGLKPHTRERCQLWEGNKGFCHPTEDDRCRTCNLFQKKRRWLW
jgi:hypothetical protein